jgi:two-component system, LytTR family, response regulator
MKVLIVDDEPLGREALKLALGPHKELMVCGEAPDGEAALEILRRKSADILLLDIQMPEMDGFQLLERAMADGIRLPVVIFVTAHDEHAIAAFEAHAADYILKPFTQPRIDRALSRAQALVRAGEANASIETLLADVRERRAGRLAIKTEGKLKVVDVSDIQWIEAKSNYVEIHCAAANHLVRETLLNVETRLQCHPFVRIHRSIIVNMECIREVEPWYTGEYIIRLSNGKEFSVSRKYKENLKKIAALTIGAADFGP